MNYLQIVNRIRRRVGEDQTGDLATLLGLASPAASSDLVIAELVNRVYHEVEILREWWWLEKETRIRLFPAYSTGPVANTAGSTTVTGTTTTWVTSGILPGDYFKLIGKQEYYEIQTVASNTSLVLTSSIVDANTTATYQIVRPRYSFPTKYRRVRTITRPRDAIILAPLSSDELEDRRQRRGSLIYVQDPSHYTAFGVDEAGNRILWFDPCPKTAQDVLVKYIRKADDLVEDSDIPLIPSEYQEILVDGVLRQYYKHQLDDASRTALASQDFEFWLRQMLQEQEAFDSPFLQLQVDQSTRANILAGVMWDRLDEATLHVIRAQL